MKRNTLRFHYGNSWLMAALVVFLLLCFMAMLRGADGPPPPPGFKPVLHSPKGAEQMSLPMAVVIPLPPSTPANILETCHFACQYAGEWGGKHYYTFSVDWNGTLETSTDLVHWDVIQDKSENVTYSTSIVGYFISESSDKVRYFRAVP